MTLTTKAGGVTIKRKAPAMPSPKPSKTFVCHVCEKTWGADKMGRQKNVCKGCALRKNREGHLWRTYRITLDEYRAMREAQGGRCAVCRKVAEKTMHVDHDHKTGLVRGLLCWNCNHQLIGRAAPTPDALRRAANYLEHHPAIDVIGERVAPGPKKKTRKRKKKTKPSD